MKIYFIIAFAVMLISCKGQNQKQQTNIVSPSKKDTGMIEKFDMEEYKKTNYGGEKYIKADGTEILSIGFDEEKGGGVVFPP